MPDVAIAVDNHDVRSALAELPADRAAEYASSNDNHTHVEYFGPWPARWTLSKRGPRTTMLSLFFGDCIEWAQRV